MWLLACAAVALPARAATVGETATRFKRLGVEEGLSSNWILAVLRDSRGFLWVGTQDGLDRYDGGKFVNYRHVPGDPSTIPSPVAGVLFEDSRGRLWVGSRWGNQGMALYRRDLDRFERLPVGPENRGLSDPRVNAIAEAPGGRLWVGTAKGVDLVDYDKGLFETYALEPSGEGVSPPRLITALLADRKGKLWVGTTRGLYQLDPRRKSCTPWRGFPESGVSLLDGQRIEALLEDEAGAIWAATLTAGLFEIDFENQRVRPHQPRPGDAASLSHLRTRCLALDGQGGLWVGTENGGLDRLDRRSGRFEHHTPDPFTPGKLVSASIYTLLADRQGILWVGTYDGGLNYSSPVEQRFSLVTPTAGGLPDPRVSAFLEDREGHLWIGTDGGGLCRVDARSGKYICLTSQAEDRETIASNSVLTLAEGVDGTIWLGGWGGGLGRLDSKTFAIKRFRHAPDDASSIVSDDVWRVRQLRTGELLVGTRRGADLFDPRSGRSSRLSARYQGIADDMTLVVAEEQDGDLWIGQSGRLQHVRRETGVVTIYALGEPGALHLDRGQIFAIIEDSRKNVWIGGEGGLFCLPSSRAVGDGLLPIPGLPHRVVTNVLEDASGNLWVTTHRGLSKLGGAVRDPARFDAVHFDVHDGLQGSEFSRGAALRARDGRLYVGGPRGFNAFYPERLLLNTEPPKVVLTGLRVFNRAVSPAEPGSPLAQSITETRALSISQDLFVVTFEFAALNLVLPQKNRYAYMLEGLETTWNEAGARREATYTRLPRGDYVFRVRAANNDGAWNHAGLALSLRVRPRWHEVLATRVMLAILGVLLVAGGVGWRVRRYVRRERELSRRVEERTCALHALNDELEQRVLARTTELAEEKERLSVTLRSIGDAVIATDVEGRIGLLNRVAEQLTGFAAEAALGRTLAEVLPRLDPKTRGPMPDAVAAVLGAAQPGPVPCECLLARADGKEFVIAESAAAIRDQAGRTLGVVLAFRDITGQRKLEEQLLNTQKLEALGILAGGIAHDFNNVLTGVFGYLELARLHAAEKAKAADMLANASSLIDKARGLTGQLLTFAKGGTPVMAPLPLPSQLAKNAEFALSGSNVACKLQLASDLWGCLGDRRQIDQVFDNLLLNARQAMPDGGTVTVAADNTLLDSSSDLPLPAGRYVRVTVADQGPGIPKEIRGRIFEPFFTTKPKGTGLGLATVYSIVRKHGGHIEVSSPAGGGASFRVYLPAAERAAAASSDGLAPAGARPCRVLLMDDDPHVREVAQRMLSQLGHTVEAVADGHAALSAFEAARASGRPFDAILLDLTIPGGFGGRDVVARMLELDPGVKAVAASGYSADPAMANPGGHGFAAKLDKPYTIGDLARVIEKVLVQPVSTGS